MKKRLRKKLRILDFQDSVFHIRFSLTVPDNNEANGTFMDKLFPFVEVNGLMISGTLTDFYMQPEHRRWATETDRQLLLEWLPQQPEISNFEVGLLLDAWRGLGSHLSRPGIGRPNVVAAHLLTQAQIAF